VLLLLQVLEQRLCWWYRADPAAAPHSMVDMAVCTAENNQRLLHRRK
jgi:hypothetical protein